MRRTTPPTCTFIPRAASSTGRTEATTASSRSRIDQASGKADARSATSRHRAARLGTSRIDLSGPLPLRGESEHGHGGRVSGSTSEREADADRAAVRRADARLHQDVPTGLGRRRPLADLRRWDTAGRIGARRCRCRPDASQLRSPLVPLGARPARRSYLVSRDSPDYLQYAGLRPLWALPRRVPDVRRREGRGAVPSGKGRADPRRLRGSARRQVADAPRPRLQLPRLPGLRDDLSLRSAGSGTSSSARAPSPSRRLGTRSWSGSFGSSPSDSCSSPAARLAAFTRFGRLYQTLGLQWLVRGSGVLRMLPGELGRLAEVEALIPKIPARGRCTRSCRRCFPPTASADTASASSSAA